MLGGVGFNDPCTTGDIPYIELGYRTLPTNIGPAKLVDSQSQTPFSTLRPYSFMLALW